jgi:hypothetical protein
VAQGAGVTRGSGTLFVLSLLAALVLAPGASASWDSSAGGFATAKARTMPTGSTPTAVRSNRSVTVSWTQASFSGGPAVSGYQVRRYSTAGVLQTIGSGCNTTISGLTCTETAVPAGSWRYSVTPRQGLWAGAESARSATVTVSAPTLSLTPTTVATTPATLTGSIANFIPGQTVTFRLDNATTGTLLTGSISPTPVQSSGAAGVSLTLPVGVTAGTHRVFAVGSGGESARSGVITVGPAFVKNVGQSSCGTGSAAVTVPAAGVAAGNTLVLRVALRGTVAGPITASDSRGNTYALDADRLGGAQRVAVLRARVTTALTAGNTINVTFPASASSGLVADEYTRLANSPLDVSATAAGTGATPSVSVTTTAASTLLVGAVSSAAQLSSSNPSGWTASTNQSLSCGPLSNTGHRRLPATTGLYAYNPTLSGSVVWAAALVAYRAG